MTAASVSSVKVIMAQAIPYLAFDGNCSGAMRFNKRVLGLGAKLEMMLGGAGPPVAARASSLRRRLPYLRPRYPAHMPRDGMQGVTISPAAFRGQSTAAAAAPTGCRQRRRTGSVEPPLRSNPTARIQLEGE
jgi:hypothetical protein